MGFTDSPFQGGRWDARVKGSSAEAAAARRNVQDMTRRLAGGDPAVESEMLEMLGLAESSR